MKQIQLLGLSLLILSLTACGQSEQKKVQKVIENNWKTITENGYSIQYPETWDLDKSGQMGMSFILLSKKSSPQDKFRENINLMIQDLKGMNIDLNKYNEISEGQIKTMITNSNLLESKRVKANDNEFQKVIYSGDEGIYKLKFEQYYWVKNGKAYVLTLTCELDQFDAYKTTGEKILNSFNFN